MFFCFSEKNGVLTFLPLAPFLPPESAVPPPTHLYNLIINVARGEIIMHNLYANLVWHKMFFKLNTTDFIQSDKKTMAVFFWYLVKSDLTSVRYILYSRIQNKSLFTRFQYNTAMFIWSGRSRVSIHIHYIVYS